MLINDHVSEEREKDILLVYKIQTDESSFGTERERELVKELIQNLAANPTWTDSDMLPENTTFKEMVEAIITCLGRRISDYSIDPDEEIGEHRRVFENLCIYLQSLEPKNRTGYFSDVCFPIER